MKKKLYLILLFALIVFPLATACTPSSNKEPLSKEEIVEMYRKPNNFKGRSIEISGKVFSVDGSTLQIWGDPINNSNITLVDISNIKTVMPNKGYVIVKGTVLGEGKGNNMIGGEITAVMIDAQEIIQADYVTVVAPTLKTIDVNQTITQNGCSLTLDKIEFSNLDTRFYLTAINNSTDKFYIYNSHMSVLQNGSQYKSESNFIADYPSFSSELFPGVTTQAIVAFPKLKQSDLKFVSESSSRSYNLEFEPYAFDIKISENTGTTQVSKNNSELIALLKSELLKFDQNITFPEDSAWDITSNQDTFFIVKTNTSDGKKIAAGISFINDKYTINLLRFDENSIIDDNTVN